MKFATTCVRAWTWLYTLGLPAYERIARRNEIAADLWECQHDAAAGHGSGSALHLLARLFLGMPDDLGWRVEQASVSSTLTQGGIALSGRVAGAALVVCAVWVIDVDASRRRPVLSIAEQPAIFSQAIERTMTMGADNVRPRSGTRLSLVTAGIVATVGMSMLPELAAPQTPGGPAFEVASVRPNTSGDDRTQLEPQPGGRLTATNVTAGMLIRFAYDLPDFQVAGGPDWVSSDRFDIVAKAATDAPLDQKRLMLRRLLVERFKLAVHTETRELAIYALAMARSDGRLGTQLHRTKTDCSAAEPPSLLGVGMSPEGGAPSCGYFGFAPGTQFSAGRGGLAFRGLTMSALAKAFVPILRRSVRDRTNLTGYLDGDFDFIAELPIPPPPPGRPNPFKAPFGSVFSVLPQQLGLKLESTKGPVDVLVIDSVARATPE